MGDLQTQLEELKKAWENETMQRMRLEQELEAIRGQHAALMAASKAGSANGAAQIQAQTQQKHPQPPARPEGEALKRSGDTVADAESGEKDVKRQRTG